MQPLQLHQILLQR